MKNRESFLVRGLLLGFIIGLVISGITAFPLATELRWLTDRMGEQPGALYAWLVKVRDSLEATDAHYPFLAYGTDWLAFAHLVIAGLFVGPYKDPVKNLWVIRWGQWACVAVIPLALICGEIRGIPFWWRLIDCSFGVVGIVPLTICVRLIQRMARTGDRSDPVPA